MPAMTSRATAEAAPNIAFIKYWGARDLSRAIPNNPSISMTLNRCVSRCTAEHLPQGGEDEIWLAQGDGELRRPGAEFSRRIQAHLSYLKDWAGCGGRFRVATRNNFPSATGLASSASGFAALTVAVVRSLGLDPPPQELSSLARMSGSGSAARSVLGGFVEWPAEGGGRGDEECYAFPLAEAGHWALADVIAIVESEAKEVSSRQGHSRAHTSPYYPTRQELLPQRLEEVRQAIRERDFPRLVPVVEEEAVDLHLIAMSSRPPIFYWRAATLTVLEAVRQLRLEGIEACATMDAGANVHVLCPVESEGAVAARLQGLSGVQSVIRDGVGPGPRTVEEDLLG